MSDVPQLPVSSVSPAPGALRIVQKFVNTLDVEDDRDELSDVDSCRRWVDAVAPGAAYAGAIRPADLERARRLRDHLRTALSANHDGRGLPDVTADALTAAARDVGLAPVFTPEGVNLTTPSRGLDGLIGAVVSAVASAVSDGTWQRLKTCRNDACRWAFYDRSRSRSGQWCSMKICGNRAKQAKWRAQHA